MRYSVFNKSRIFITRIACHEFMQYLSVCDVSQADPEALYMKMNDVQADILKSNNAVSIYRLLVL